MRDRPAIPSLPQRRTRPTCLIDGCTEWVQARQLCQRHYNLARRQNPVLAEADRERARRWYAEHREEKLARLKAKRAEKKLAARRDSDSAGSSMVTAQQEES